MLKFGLDSINLTFDNATKGGCSKIIVKQKLTWRPRKIPRGIAWSRLVVNTVATMTFQIGKQKKSGLISRRMGI